MSLQHSTSTDDHSKSSNEARRAEFEEQKSIIKSLFDNSPLLLGVAELDGDTIIGVNGNAAVAKFLGLSPDDIPHQTGEELGNSPEENQIWLEHYRRSLQEGKPVIFEYERPYRNSSQWLSATVNYLGTGSQNRPRFSFIAEDITQRKQLDQALEASERKYRELIQYAPVGVFEIDFRSGRLTSVNASVADLTGYSQEEMLQMSAFDLLDQESQYHFSERIRQWLSGEKPEESVAYRVIAKDGHTIYAVLNVSFTKDEYGQPLGATVIGYDITERKRAEEALKESEEKYRSLFENLTSAAVVCEPIVDEDGRLVDLRYLMANPALENHIGKTPEELVGKCYSEVFSYSGRNPVFDIYEQVLSTGEPYKGELFLPAVNRDQEIAIFRPAPNRLALILSDITKRKRAELALYESEQREKARRVELEAVMDAVPAYMWITRDPQAHEMTGNQATLDLMRMQPEDNLSKTGPEPEKVRHVMAMRDGQEIIGDQLPIQQVAATGQLLRDYEFDIVFEDGKIRHLLGNAQPLLDEQGQSAGAVGAFIDITERKQAEDALRQSESRLREFIEGTHDTYFSLDREWRFTYANRKFGELMGIDPQAVIGQNFWELFPHYRGTDVEPLYRKVMTERVPVHFRRGGIYTKNVYDLSLYPTQEGLASFAIDRTAEFHQQQQLANERARLEAVLQVLTVGVWITDTDGRIIGKNPQVDRIWAGAAPMVEGVDEYHQYPSWDAHSGKKLETEDFPLTRTLRSGAPVAAEEHRILRLDGSEGFVLVSAVPIKDGEGRLAGAVAINVDLTERKRIEEEQREHQVQLEIQRRLLEYRDQERQSIARDLHDGPVQDLSSLLFNVQFAKEAISDRSIQLELEKIAAGLKTSVQNLRGMVNELRPPSLIRFGLAKALNLFLEDFREKHPEIEFNVSLMDDKNCLSEPARLALFRIVQEALTNAVKHANANQMDVTLRCEDHQVVLEIHDDGNGFPLSGDLLEYSSKGHFGLVGMKERADAVDGAFQVQSSPGEGTTITVIVPANN